MFQLEFNIYISQRLISHQKASQWIDSINENQYVVKRRAPLSLLAISNTYNNIGCHSSFLEAFLKPQFLVSQRKIYRLSQNVLVAALAGGASIMAHIRVAGDQIEVYFSLWEHAGAVVEKVQTLRYLFTQ